MQTKSTPRVPEWVRGPGPKSVRDELAYAADALLIAQQRALLRGDRDAADRLAQLERVVEYEAEYTDLVEHLDFPVVARRTDAPEGATVGWFITHDGAVRAARQAAGIPVDYDQAVR